MQERLCLLYGNDNRIDPSVVWVLSTVSRSVSARYLTIQIIIWKYDIGIVQVVLVDL